MGLFILEARRQAQVKQIAWVKFHLLWEQSVRTSETCLLGVFVIVIVLDDATLGRYLFDEVVDVLRVAFSHHIFLLLIDDSVSYIQDFHLREVVGHILSLPQRRIVGDDQDIVSDRQCLQGLFQPLLIHIGTLFEPRVSFNVGLQSIKQIIYRLLDQKMHVSASQPLDRVETLVSFLHNLLKIFIVSTSDVREV